MSLVCEGHLARGRTEMRRQELLEQLGHLTRKDGRWSILKARVVKSSVTKIWSVYTDGAYGLDGAVNAFTRAVLLDGQGMVAECFGLELDDSLRQEFL